MDKRSDQLVRDYTEVNHHLNADDGEMHNPYGAKQYPFVAPSSKRR